MADWFEQEFGGCPHGGAKPYCPQCAGDELEADREERARKREERSQAGLRETAAHQTQELDTAYSIIRGLRRRLRG